MSECQCRSPGYCPRWDRDVSQLGQRICKRGDEKSLKKYFGVSEIPPCDHAGPIGDIAPIRHENGRLARTVERPWEGKQKRKPWDYRVSVAIAHLDTSDLLETAVGLWQSQAETPYLLIFDTGSLPRHQRVLDRLEAEHDNVEVHRIRGKAWRATSQPVAAAMDLAFAVAQTDILIGTHTDVLPKKRELAGWLVDQCDAQTPLVGWQMSPRDHWPEPLWKDMPSHSCTAYHMPTARRLGWRWNMLGAFERLGIPPAQPPHGFPDTEVMLGLLLREQGVQWKCLGPEPNATYETEWFVHLRSTTVKNLYGAPDATDRAAVLANAVGDAQRRIVRWNKPRVQKGKCGPCQAAKAK